MGEFAPTDTGSAGRRLAAAFVVIAVVAAIAWLARRGEEVAVGRGALATTPNPSVGGLAVVDPLDAPTPAAESRMVSIVDETRVGTSAPTTVEADIRRLVVEVVDTAGRGLAGVKVTGLVPRNDSTFAEATTDANGRANLACETSELSGATLLCVGTPCLATTPSRIEFAATEWPTNAVRLVAGPSGSIEISFQTEVPYPLNRGAHAWIYFDGERCGDEPARGLHETNVGSDLATWTLRVPHVALGLCFQMGSYTPGLEFEDATFEGPTIDGQVVHVNAALEEVGIRIVGRLVDREGAALGNHHVIVEWIPGAEPSGRSGRWFERETDPDGTFEEFSRTHDADRASSKLSIRAEGPGRVARSGTVTWPGIASAALVREIPTIDLGDIVVESEPILASGRGLGVPGEQFRAWAYVGIELRSLDPDFGGRWSRVNSRVARDGTFQVGGHRPLQRFELRAYAYDRLPSEPVTVERGAHGVELRLRAGGHVEGRLLVAEGVDPDVLDLWIPCIEPAGSSEHRLRGWETFDDGRFQLRSVLPGRYEVIVSHEEVELAHLAFTATLEVPTLELEPIDLRDVVHPITLKFVGRDGSAVESGTVAVLRDEELFGSATIDRRGRTTLCALTRVVDVLVAAPGFATQRIEGVTNDATIALEMGVAVRVRIPDLPPAPTGWAYEVELEPQGEDLFADNSEIVRGRLDARGSAQLRAPYRGSFELSASLRGPGRHDTRFIAVRERVQIGPRADGSVMELTLEADAAAVRDAIESLRDP